MSRIVYVNGSFVPEADAKISVFDRAFLFAEGVYEVTAVLGGRPVDLENHLARLDRSLAEMQIHPPAQPRRAPRVACRADRAEQGRGRHRLSGDHPRRGGSRLSLSRRRAADRGRLHPKPAPARQPLCRDRRQGDHPPRPSLETARHQIDRAAGSEHGQAGSKAPRRLRGVDGRGWLRHRGHVIYRLHPRCERHDPHPAARPPYPAQA